MKNLKLALLAAFAGLVTAASAQPVDASGSDTPASDHSPHTQAVKTTGWNRIFYSYNPSKIAYDASNTTDDDLKGISVGYLRGFSLTRKAPLYMEMGAAFQYRFTESYAGSSDTTYDEELGYASVSYSARVHMMSVNVPINLLYRFNINDQLSISPYFGLDFRYNVACKIKVKMRNFYGEYGEYERVNASKSFSLFDKEFMDQMGVEPFNRFQPGFHAGIGLDYRMLHLAVDLGKDFDELSPTGKGKIKTTSIIVGINF